MRFSYVDNRAGDASTYTGPRTNAFTTLIGGFLAGDDGARWKLTLSFFDVVHPGGDWVRSGGGYTFTRQGR